MSTESSSLRAPAQVHAAENFAGIYWPEAAKVLGGFLRRFRRERRRRKVGRAYDMALEMARTIPRGSEVLDVGCGHGFIAHHLSAMLGKGVIGIDVMPATQAPIDFRRYDGRHFPAEDNSFDAVLLCYVLHHARDVHLMLNEVRRVLREDGLVIIYEDIPLTMWDRALCRIHSRRWKGRSGPCSFRNESQWPALLSAAGWEIVSARRLSRWRNLTHPVTRASFVLQPQRPAGAIAHSAARPANQRNQLLVSCGTEG